jgi:hypothetical protein
MPALRKQAQIFEVVLTGVFFQESARVVASGLSIVRYVMVYLATKQLKHPLAGSSKQQAQGIGGVVRPWA